MTQKMTLVGCGIAAILMMLVTVDSGSARTGKKRHLLSAVKVTAQADRDRDGDGGNCFVAGNDRSLTFTISGLGADVEAGTATVEIYKGSSMSRTLPLGLVSGIKRPTTAAEDSKKGNISGGTAVVTFPADGDDGASSSKTACPKCQHLGTGPDYLVGISVNPPPAATNAATTYYYHYKTVPVGRHCSP